MPLKPEDIDAQIAETQELLELLHKVREKLKREGLPSGSQHDTLNTMNATPTSDSLRSRGRLTAEARRHPFVVALIKRNETVAEAAAWLSAKLGRPVPRSTVQAWYKAKDDPGYRAIPADAELALRQRYKVPRSAWPRVAD